MRKTDVAFYDHKLNAERPLELEYFNASKPIPYSIIDMHQTVHLGVILQGSLTGWIDGHEVVIPAGGVWLLGPLEPHTTLAQSDDREAVVATFMIEELGRGFGGWDVPFMAPFAVNAAVRHEILTNCRDRRIMDMALEMRHLMETESGYSAFRLWLKLHELFAVLLEMFEDVVPPGAASGMERLKPALLLPKKRPGVPVSLDEAAKVCNLSPGRFGELFRQYSGNSFGQYEMRCRLSGARNEVMAGMKTFQEVAMAWGFYDESHFSHLFKRLYGCTPGVYRKKHLEFRKKQK